MKRLMTLLIALLVLSSGYVAGAACAGQVRDEPKKEKKDQEASKDDSKDSDDADDEDDSDEPKAKEKSAPKKADSSKEKEVKSATSRDAKDNAKETAKKTPTVKRLMEVRLDSFLVPARAFNLALPGRTKTLRELLERFDKWSKDEDVGAILLNIDNPNLALPDVEELRAGVAQLRKAGKRVHAFLNGGDDMGYLIACAADEVAVAPTGGLAIPGQGRLFPFMRGLYQLQGLEFDVITAGKYKYPGFLNSREPNKYFLEEFNEILDSWYGDYVSFIAQGRKLDDETVRKAIDTCLFDAKEAKNRGLVDVIAYYDEYSDRVVKRTKFRKMADGESDFSRITSFNDILNAINAEAKRSEASYKEVGPKIAVLHARGPIVDLSMGGGVLSSSLIMRDEFVKTVEEIRKNKTIQAVVLRIDSPGGSGYASDVIWRKLKELDEEKPLIVSMGTVAGSGGYYIACPGRLIFAEPTTITGSIGVLAILVNQASAINRMDVNLAEMKRGERALFGAGHRDMSPADRDYLQKYLLDFYEVFLDRVASGRKMPKDEVRKIAEGRIYTGRQALKIGLVDRLGTLQDAIGAAREAANLPPSAELKIVNYPRPSSIGELLFEGLGGGMSMAESVAAKTQSPAPTVSFDRQLRLFSQRPQALCWMALPNLEALLNPRGMPDVVRDVLGVPAPTSIP